MQLVLCLSACDVKVGGWTLGRGHLLSTSLSLSLLIQPVPTSAPLFLSLSVRLNSLFPSSALPHPSYLTLLLQQSVN